MSDYYPHSTVHLSDMEPGTSMTCILNISENALYKSLKEVINESNVQLVAAGVQSGLIVLPELRTALDTGITHSQESRDVSDLKNTIQDALAVGGRKYIAELGFCGPTGAGKTSLINAILGMERLLPANPMRASTAVVTKVLWNESDDPEERFRAEVKFVEKQSLREELGFLLGDIKDEKGQLSAECDVKGSEANIAWEKIRALFPHKTKKVLLEASVEPLLNEQHVAAVLGTTKTLRARTISEFRPQLRDYIECKDILDTSTTANGKNVAELWPLCQTVKVFVKTPILKDGIVLVDLPGVEDTNEARAAIARTYWARCTDLLIVAPIDRARSNRAAHELLDKRRRRQNIMDGYTSHVTWICTKTDDIDINLCFDSITGWGEDVLAIRQELEASETRRNQVDTELQEAEKQKAQQFEKMETLRKQRGAGLAIRRDVQGRKTVHGHEVIDAGGKRKSNTGSILPPRPAKKRTAKEGFMSAIGDKLAEVQHEGAAVGLVYTLEKIEERLVKLQDMKDKIKQLYSTLERCHYQLLEKSRAAHEEVAALRNRLNAACIIKRNEMSKAAIRKEYKAETMALHRENAKLRQRAGMNALREIDDEELGTKELPVFCVSSQSFLDLSKSTRKGATTDQIARIDETEIPLVREHIIKLTEAGRKSHYRKFLNHLLKIILEIKLVGERKPTNEEQAELLRQEEIKFLAKEIEGLQLRSDTSISRAHTNLKSSFESNICADLPQLVKYLKTNASTVIKELGEAHWASLRAVCRHRGVHVMRNKKEKYNVNEDLAQPATKLLMTGWRNVFDIEIPGILDDMIDELINPIVTLRNLMEIQAAKPGARIVGVNFLEEKVVIHISEFNSLREELSASILKERRRIRSRFVPIIKQHMLEAYSHCARDSGPGTAKRMKNHLKSYIEKEKDPMFNEIAKELKAELEGVCIVVMSTCKKESQKIFGEIQHSFFNAIGGKDRTPDNLTPEQRETVSQQLIRHVQHTEQRFLNLCNDAKAIHSLEEADPSILRFNVEETHDNCDDITVHYDNDDEEVGDEDDEGMLFFPSYGYGPDTQGVSGRQPDDDVLGNWSD